MISNTEEIKPLGVSSDKDLHFSKHIADIVRKVGNQIKVLQRHKNVIDVYAKMRLYNGYLLPHLTYCPTRRNSNKLEEFRACLQGGGGPQVGEVTRLFI